MRKKNRTLNNFQRELRDINELCSKIKAAYEAGIFSASHVATLFEGAFLNAVVSFEAFLETIFFETLAIKKHPTLGPRAAIVGTSRIIRDITLAGDDYFDWLPFRKTIDRANLYLRGGRPFSFVDQGQLSQLTQIYLLRNAIAHKSDYAMDRFREKVIGGSKVRPHERNPGWYLRAEAQPNYTRLSIYISQIGAVSEKFRS